MNLPSALTKDKLTLLQAQDTELLPIINYLKNGTLPDEIHTAQKLIMQCVLRNR